MKFLHLADLHIGKRVNEFSMLEDQRHIFGQILNVARAEKPDAVLIAGDIYDKTVPPGEAVEVLDDFLTSFAGQKIPVFLIAGNHDSPERLGFASRLLEKSGVCIVSSFRGTLPEISLSDAYGPVKLYLLPFVKPAVVAPFFPELKIESYEDAVRAAVRNVPKDETRRVLVAHQFVTNAGVSPERSDSETVSIGGVDNVDASVFDAFDYVALGHLHGPQKILRETIRYAGSPLKYSFSECRQKKSVTVVELKEKGDVEIRRIPLVPLRDMREIRGPLDGLVSAAEENGREDYIHAILTDEGELFDPIGRLRTVYPNVMRLDFENRKPAGGRYPETAARGDVSHKDPMELFEEFFLLQNQTEMTRDQKEIMKSLFEQTGGMRG